MATPSTVATYALDNSQRDFDVTFDYLSQTFVQVSLIGETAQILALGSDYTFLSPTVIRTTLTYGPPDWAFIEVRRVTSTTERLVEFNDASILQASDLNLSDIQVLHVAEEARNAATETIGINNDGNLDARGRRLVNVADPVDLGDAVNIRWYQERVDGTHADRLAAEAAKIAAEAAAAAAQASQSSASSSASSASTSASNAEVSANSAAASAVVATNKAADATTYAAAAGIFKDNAATSAASASTSEVNAAASAAAAAASAASVDDANLVHKSGAESITGIKTFTVSPKVPNASAADEPVSKQQLDSVYSELDGRLDVLEPLVYTKAASGTSVVFSAATGAPFPATATSITIVLDGVSLTDNSIIGVQVGSGGVLQTSGYAGSATGFAVTVAQSTVSASKAMLLRSGMAASASYLGIIHLEKLSSNIWLMTSTIADASGATGIAGNRVSLSGVLNTLAIVTDIGTATFDSGTVTVKVR